MSLTQCNADGSLHYPYCRLPGPSLQGLVEDRGIFDVTLMPLAYERRHHWYRTNPGEHSTPSKWF